jgi:hypothetical protein
VKLDAAGRVCVFTDAGAHILVDANGALPTATYTAVVPARVADTRRPDSTIDGLHAGAGPVGGRQALEVQIAGRGGIPSSAGSAVLNVTVVGAHAAGFATLYPCDGHPNLASTLNYATGVVIANSSVARLSATGSVCVFTHAAADVVIDAGGYFAAGA